MGERSKQAALAKVCWIKRRHEVATQLKNTVRHMGYGATTPRTVEESWMGIRMTQPLRIIKVDQLSSVLNNLLG